MRLRIVIFALAALWNPSTATAQLPKYDWLLIYYMPYDNNLSALSQSIFDQFDNTTFRGNVGVILQTDLAGPGGMKRFSSEGQRWTIIPNEDSGSASALDEYLTSIPPNSAKHYAIILLNHGGLIDEYGLDEYPNERWITMDSLATSIRKFNKRVHVDKIDLLFEQVCSRGTIENLYEFRDLAKYTLASQSLVPAPGYYYSSVFNSLEQGGIIGGVSLADAIVGSERDDMYYSYTLVDNSKWNEWIVLLETYSSTFQNGAITVVPDSLKTLSYWHDYYWDMKSTIRATRNKAHGQVEAQPLLAFTYHQLVRKRYISKLDTRMNGYSGISILSPFQENDRQINMSIFQLPAFKNWIQGLKSSHKANR